MINNNPEVVIVMARCNHEKAYFGIRFEKKEQQFWVGDWTFAIKESAARKEHYDRNAISGSIYMDPHYPGCPFCKSMAIARCGRCNKVSCYDGESKMLVCPWCNTKSKVEGTITYLDAGADR